MCKTDSECPKGQRCTGGTCTATARAVASELSDVLVKDVRITGVLAGRQATLEALPIGDLVLQSD